MPNGVDYLLIVKAQLPSVNGNVFAATASFNLNIKAPCYDSQYYTVTAVPVPDFSYLLFSTFTPLIHNPFTVTATPEVLALCGNLAYNINGGGLASYLSYNQNTREIDIYAENLNLLSGSPFTYTITAQLTSFNGYGTASSNGLVTILNPCESLTSFTMTGISNEVSNYDGTVFFDTPVLTADPNVCTPQAAFTCSYDNINGPYTGALDLCNFSMTNGQYSSAASFSPTSGQLTFNSNDKDTFPPGVYEFTVTATIYGQTQQTIFTLTLNDACETAVLSIGTNPFEGSFEYVLNNGFYTITYDVDFLVTSSTSVNCGAPVLTFLTETNQAIDTEIFFENRSVAGAWTWRIGFSDDASKAGNYRLKWRYHYGTYTT